MKDSYIRGGSRSRLYPSEDRVKGDNIVLGMHKATRYNS